MGFLPPFGSDAWTQAVLPRPQISAACSVAPAMFKLLCGGVIINLDIAIGGSLTRLLFFTLLSHRASRRVQCELVGHKPLVRIPPWSSYKGTPHPPPFAVAGPMSED